MCPAAKNPICAMKLPHVPNQSPRAENNSAAHICHGVSPSEATKSVATGNTSLCGTGTGRKNSTAKAKNTAVAVKVLVFGVIGGLSLLFSAKIPFLLFWYNTTRQTGGRDRLTVVRW